MFLNFSLRRPPDAFKIVFKRKICKAQLIIPLIMLLLLLTEISFASNKVTVNKVFDIQQDKITVSGIVTDASGEALPGVNIAAKGFATGVITDNNGKYTITLTKSMTTLLFSYVGFASREININGRTVIDVIMDENIQNIDEVVVIGYGTQKKKLITGATVQVKGEDISKLNTVNTLGALQGQTPGVNITKWNGKPGESFKVIIRGLGTIGDSQPLFIIDGIAGDIDVLNVDDIESVDVLKDAASAAIYGARAANGVILVTTKHGRKDNSSVQYSGYVGWQNVYKKAQLLNAKEYAFIMNEANMNDGKPRWDFASLVPDWDRIEDGSWEGTNWLEEMTVNNAPVMNHSVSVTGGTERSTYSIGAGYTAQDGIIGTEKIESRYQRYTTRINTEHLLIKHNDLELLKLGENLTFAYSRRRGLDIGTDDMYWNDINNALKADPFMPAYNEDGSYHGAIPWDAQAMNPLADLDYGRSQSVTNDYNMKGNIFFTLQPIKNLIYKFSFGTTLSAGSRRAYSPSYYLDQLHYRGEEDDQVSASMYAGLSWQLENTLSYDFMINNSHHFNVLGGTSAEKWGYGESIEAVNSNSIFNDFEHAYISNTKKIDPARTYVGGYPWGKGGIMSYFGRINYDYNEKYMSSIVLRADGSSNFAKGRRWGIFPSISAGWDIIKEDFFENNREYVNQLKIRVSWGQNGNQSIPAFQYLSTISFDGVDYFFGTDKTYKTTGAYPDILANPDLTWETSEQTDIGLDARFLQYRLSFVFDWYNKLTKDWLVRAPILDTYGTGAPYINGGDVRNRGIEAGLGWNDKIGDFHYSINANMSQNTNKVMRIANEEGIIYGPSGILSEGTAELYRAQVGYPIGYFVGYKAEGIFQNELEVQEYVHTDGKMIQPEAVPGNIRYADLNNDGKITPEDRTMLGNPHPKFIGGFSWNIEWKGIDLSMMSNGMLGFQIAKSYRSFADLPRQNYTKDILDRWHGEGTSNTIPKLTSGTHIDWEYISGRFIENGDYWRISNITLGFDLKKFLTSLPLTQCRVYLTVQNPFTFTGYSGMDPEIGYGGNSDWASSIDLGFYPSPRTLMTGVNVKF